MDDYELFKMNMLQAYRKRTDRDERIVEQYHMEHAITGSDGSSSMLEMGQKARARKRRTSVIYKTTAIIQGSDAKDLIVGDPRGSADLIQPPEGVDYDSSEETDRLQPSVRRISVSRPPEDRCGSGNGHGGSGDRAVEGEDVGAVMDKLMMMEKRQDTLEVKNDHKVAALAAQYDSLGERLGSIERSMQSIADAVNGAGLVIGGRGGVRLPGAVQSDSL